MFGFACNLSHMSKLKDRRGAHFVTTGATCGAPAFTPGVQLGSCCSICVMFYGSLFVLLPFFLLAIMYCPPFFFWPSCIVRPFSFGHHVLSALLRFTVSDRHLCIFTLSCDDLMYINLNYIIVPGTIRIMGVQYTCKCATHKNRMIITCFLLHM